MRSGREEQRAGCAEMGRTGRGSSGAQDGRAHPRQALIQLRQRVPTKQQSQARVTQSKEGDRTGARGEGTLAAGAMPGAGGSVRVRGWMSRGGQHPALPPDPGCIQHRFDPAFVFRQHSLTFTGGSFIPTVNNL